MKAWYVPGAVLAFLAVVSVGQAQTCSLTELVKPGESFRYRVDMKLNGELRFRKDDRDQTIKLEATATHAYPERALESSGAFVQKSARLYETARATIKVGNETMQRTLRPSRQLVVAQRHKDQHLVYCPAGALFRGELDLVSEHFDTLSIASVLPGKTVKVGESWKLVNSAAQALCHLEGLTENKLEGKLLRVTGDRAVFQITGTAAGVEQGALVKMTIEAEGTFDVKAGRVRSLEWKQKDDREMGPVSPASSVQSQVKIDREPIAGPKTLDDVALVSVPQGFSPPSSMVHVEYRDPKSRYSLLHPRDWQLTAATDEHTVLRLVDRGDFVAQVTVTPWTKAKKGEHLSPEQFKQAMHATSGWRPERELQAGEVPSTDGRWIYRLSVQGELNGVQVLQNFVLVANPEGEQVVLTFTLSPKQADKLGARDLALAGSIEIPAVSEKK